MTHFGNSLIWSCPDCGTDLDVIEGGLLWCPACHQSVTPARLAYTDPPDYQHPDGDPR